MRLITPKRLKENEDFMWRFADRLIDAFYGDGSFEMVGSYAEPFTLTVIADLEGVPESDHSLFRERLSTAHQDVGHKPLEFLYERFNDYIEDRRRAPRHDVLTGLATATFPDGSTPEAKDAALIAANLFAGGQETTVRLLSFALRMLGERSDLQEAVRTDRERIPNFIEETLRLESPLRAQFRMARVATQLGGVDIPAGASLMLIPMTSRSTARTRGNTSPSDTGSTPAREHPWRGRRAGSPSIASSTVRPRSPFRKSTTVRWTLAATSTCRPSSCAASNASTSSSRPSAEEHGLGIHFRKERCSRSPEAATST
jgi:cytochrome P450 family 150 subfamily A5